MKINSIKLSLRVRLFLCQNEPQEVWSSIAFLQKVDDCCAHNGFLNTFGTLQNHKQLNILAQKRFLGQPLQPRENNTKTHLPPKPNLIRNLMMEFTGFFAKHITVFLFPDGKFHHLFPKHTVEPEQTVWLYSLSKLLQHFSLLLSLDPRPDTTPYHSLSCSHMHEEEFVSFGLSPCSVCQCL